MFWRILGKSLSVRKSHFVVAVTAVTMGALLVAATTTISLNIRNKIGRELRAYGPNLIILPLSSALSQESGAVQADRHYLQEQSLKAVTADRDILGFSPVLEGSGTVNGQTVNVTGLNWDAAVKIHPWWQLTGAAPGNGQVLLGQEMARKLKLSPGQSVSFTAAGGKLLYARIAGIAATGGEDDNRLIVDLPLAQELFAQQGMLSRIEASVLSVDISVEDKAKVLNAKIPGSRSKVLQQVAQAEDSLLKKIQALMYFVTAGVLTVSLLCIGGTMTTTVLQRRKEIGIMKAIGASNLAVAKLFLAEATVFGLSGGVLGLAAGFGLAQVIGVTVFKTWVNLVPSVIPATLGSACLVTWIASARPVWQAVSVQAATTLRGE